ncbi:MAG: fumarylacetoacetate hydrolase family protein [Actinophytocola sp.]|uniref:fumarylacetoacetate hydrolase family protein n=1 Tax=Actinophytocola sp. TaxID=1872138 RepID=UPI003C77A086
MRFGQVNSRPALLDADTWVDVVAASGGRFGSADAIFAAWPEFLAWATDVLSAGPDSGGRHPLDGVTIQAPQPTPRQVFGAGLNYGSHLAEAGRPVPDLPLLFTKFPSAIAGPGDDVVLATDMVDFEAELVVVMGAHADRVEQEAAWSYVAGLTAGQDLSARDVQRSGQLSIGKSFRTFAPTGPWIVTVDEFADPDDIGLRCVLNGEVVQDGRTSDMVFGVAELIALLSAVTPLLPGDLIFTGTPAGVGVFREPKLFLRPGDELVTEIEGVGTLRNTCVAVESPNPAQRRWAAVAAPTRQPTTGPDVPATEKGNG